MNNKDFEAQMLAITKTPEFKKQIEQLRDAQDREDERIKNLRPLIDRIKLKTWLKMRAIEENPLLKYCL